MDTVISPANKPATTKTVVDKIKKGNPNDNGSVANPDVIVRMVMAADAK